VWLRDWWGLLSDDDALGLSSSVEGSDEWPDLAARALS
jgi:hypothetical protein